MSILKLTHEFPPLNIRSKETLESLVNSLRSFVNTLKTLHSRIAIVVNSNADIITPIETSGAPATAPPAKGMHYIDTATDDVYISVDTSGSGDWKKITA